MTTNRAASASQLPLTLGDDAEAPATPSVRVSELPESGAERLPTTDPLPTIDIPAEWKDVQRLWGHSLHPMCSYLASFPAALAHAFVERYSRRGDVVVDPFSGRGTAPLQACAEGRTGVGNDLNPFAWLLTAAKVEPAIRAETATRLTTLRLAWAASSRAWIERSATGDVPPEVRIAFHPATLAQLLFLRSELRLEDRTDRFLAAAVTGILHGKSASYLSPLMPNTFSMAPRYVRDFAARTAFEAPDRDVFAGLDRKLVRLHRDPPPSSRGIALLGDARDVGARASVALRERGVPDRARLVVASPPYLRVVKYGYYNWLRTWFLGYDAQAIDATLDDAHRREPYLLFMREVLASLRLILAEDAVVVLVIGDVETDRGRPLVDASGVRLAERVWETAAEPEGYRLAGIASDEIAANRKMTRLWGSEAGRATKTDRILVLGATEAGRRRALSASRLPVGWDWPPTRLRPV
jgi:hypothetical protein